MVVVGDRHVKTLRQLAGGLVGAEVCAALVGEVVSAAFELDDYLWIVFKNGQALKLRWQEGVTFCVVSTDEALEAVLRFRSDYQERLQKAELGLSGVRGVPIP